MKILFLSDNFPPEVNASASRVYERACYWIKDGHSLSVITSAPNFPLGKVYKGYKNKWLHNEEMKGIHVVRVKTFMAPNKGVFLRTLDFISYMVMGIIVGIFQPKPDVIIATSPQFFTALGGWILSRIKRVPFVFEISDLWPESIKGLGLIKNCYVYKILEKIELFLYKHSSVIIAQTNAFKNNLVSRGIDSNKIKVILNGVDTNIYKPFSNKNQKIVREYHLEEKFVIGYLGTLGMAHNLKNIIDMAKHIEEYSKNIVFLFIGEGAEKENIIQHAQSIRSKNTLFLPMQPKSEIQNWWSICDVALITLKNIEIFKTVIPSKIFEATGMGLPIMLVAPDGEASQFLHEEKFGVHILPEDIESFTRQAIDLSQNESRRSTLSHASLKVAKIYSRERQAKEFINYVMEKIYSPQNIKQKLIEE